MKGIRPHIALVGMPVYYALLRFVISSSTASEASPKEAEKKRLVPRGVRVSVKLILLVTGLA